MQVSTISAHAASRSDPVSTGATASMPLRPALFARFHALDDLRYDYPLVLLDGEPDRLFRPLRRIIDDVLRAAAPPDSSGEAMRQQVLRLESKIRHHVAEGNEGRLTDLWRDCAGDLVRESGEASFGPMDTTLDAARKRLLVDGQVIGCDATTPVKVLSHAWQAKHDAKARRFRKRVDGLILKLTDILKSDHMKSDEAHRPGALVSAMGTTIGGAIDFEALSRVLTRVRPENRLPEARVSRIREVLRILQCQPFYAPGRSSQQCPKRNVPYSYRFDSCSAALAAHRQRLPEVLEFTKALTIAELEAENKYRPELHDPIFEAFDESDLTAEQLGLLPSALICLRDGVTRSAEIGRAVEALACGLPITVLIQVDDVFGPTAPEPPDDALGAGTTRLATMAMGLNNAFVLQCTSAHIYRMHDAMRHGIQHEGPALFSVYSGVGTTTRDVPAYILSAAATEARVFPNFTYDPSAGPDLASRFDLSQNPQVESDWPLHRVVYEDGSGQRKETETAFSLADLVVVDTRYRRFCHPLQGMGRGPEPVPVADWLKLSEAANESSAPFVLAIDDDNRLFRTTVDEKITEAAQRCNDAWRRLQELAGINNSHAIRLLEKERRKRAEAAQAGTAGPPQDNAPAPPETAAAAAVPPPDAVASAADEAGEGAPWIETPRCTTCNECTQISSKLFAYNDDMQAYIADPAGGTFRQLVEAAESCQVSIIHPGKPRNPQEPNLDELIERAEPFN